MLNLDTHILINIVRNKLTTKELLHLKNDQQWSISAIVMWEISKLHQLGRIHYGIDHAPIAELLTNIHIWPISQPVCLSLRLLDFKSDPADELIAATSLAHGLPLITRDRAIRKSQLINCL